MSTKAFIQACIGSDLDTIQDLIQEGIDVNGLLDGRNGLHHACSLNKKKVVELLLKNGADANRRDTNELSPMFIWMTNYNGETPGEIDLKVFKLLIRHGADVFKLFKDNRFDTLRIAITLMGNHRMGGWVNDQDYSGTPVRYKITKGAMHYIKPYNEDKADIWGRMVPMKDQKNITSKEMGLSTHANYLRMHSLVMYILEHDLMNMETVQDPSGEYMAAVCELGVGSVLKRLHSMGVDFSFKVEENGMTALLSLCLAERADGLLEFFRLMPEGYDVNETNDHGFNAAHILADKGGHLRMAKELRKHGVNLAARTTRKLGSIPKGSTPSQVAKVWDDPQMAARLKP